MRGLTHGHTLHDEVLDRANRPFSPPYITPLMPTPCHFPTQTCPIAGEAHRSANRYNRHLIGMFRQGSTGCMGRSIWIYRTGFIG